MADSSSNVNRKLGDSNVIELTGKIMMVTIMILFFIAVCVFCLHLYVKWFWRRRRQWDTTTTPTRGLRQGVTAVRRGLEPSVLKTIPVIIFDPKEFKDGLECSVCLSEVSQGEKTRLLPKCNHGFHKDCIDMWFQSHSTCPLCRDPISQSSSSTELAPETIIQATVTETPGESPNFPTNVLFWGNESQVNTLGPCLDEGHQSSATTASSQPPCSSSSSSASTSNRPDGMLVIDIPRQFNGEEEQKSPAPSRFRTLTRLLSGNLRINPCSPRNVDVEQGVRGQS